MNKQVESITKEFLNSPTLVEVDRRANPAETIQQSIYEVFEHQKIDLLKHLLASSHTFYSVIDQGRRIRPEDARVWGAAAAAAPGDA